MATESVAIQVVQEEFLDPRGEMHVEEHRLAPRLPTLRGMRLGVLDNSKTNADRYLRMVADELTKRYGIAEWKMVTKPNLSQPALAENIVEVTSDVDFVITGIGDCGSCSTCCVHDAIEIEKLGIPAVAIATDALAPGLEALKEMRGMSAYRYAVVPHPIGVLDDDGLHDRARTAAPQIEQLVVRLASRPERKG
jgi:hypothetical protein